MLARSDHQPHDDLLVAVCAFEPDGARLGETLESLAREGADPVVVVSDADPRRQEAERTAQASGRALLTVPGTGYAALHNGALEACRSELLALVDDDVTVAPGWLEALRRAWEVADEDTAFIGGPLRIRFLGPAPSWCRGSARQALAYHDYGDEPLKLDPQERTLFAGNLSFRCSALRGAEGFWPVRGRAGLRDLCTDAHQTQYSMGQLGWRGFYAPGVAAFRSVDAGALRFPDVLARRFWSGARAAILGGEPTSARIAQALAAGLRLAGAPLRRGDDRELIESTFRLATALGAMLAPLVAKGDFEQTGATAYRPFIRRVNRPRRFASARTGRARSSCAAILVYHSVGAQDGTGTARVSAANFSEQMAVLRDRRVVGTGEIASRVRRGLNPGGCVAITFDDGYADTATDALPALQACSLPASVYVATGFVASQNPFFWDEIPQLIEARAHSSERLELEVRGSRRVWLIGGEAERRLATAIVQRLAQSLSRHERDDVLRQLRSGAEGCAPAGRPMTPEELRRFAAAPGMDVGSHTVDHTSLRFQPPDEQRRELRAANQHLATWLGDGERGFAYPFGAPGVDFDQRTQALVAAEGYSYGLANVPGVVDRHSDLYALPRFPVPDVDGPDFERWVAKLL